MARIKINPSSIEKDPRFNKFLLDLNNSKHYALGLLVSFWELAERRPRQVSSNIDLFSEKLKIENEMSDKEVSVAIKALIKSRYIDILDGKKFIVLYEVG